MTSLPIDPLLPEIVSALQTREALRPAGVEALQSVRAAQPQPLAEQFEAGIERRGAGIGDHRVIISRVLRHEVNRGVGGTRPYTCVSSRTM